MELETDEQVIEPRAGRASGGGAPRSSESGTQHRGAGVRPLERNHTPYEHGVPPSLEYRLQAVWFVVPPSGGTGPAKRRPPEGGTPNQRPSTALDPIATGRSEDLIEDLKGHDSILIVTHNMQQASRVSDCTAFMYLGRLVEFGPTDEVFLFPRLEETEDYVTGRFG